MKDLDLTWAVVTRNLTVTDTIVICGERYARQQESEGVVVEAWYCSACDRLTTNADPYEEACRCGVGYKPCKARLTRIPDCE